MDEWTLHLVDEAITIVSNIENQAGGVAVTLQELRHNIVGRAQQRANSK